MNKFVRSGNALVLLVALFFTTLVVRSYTSIFRFMNNYLLDFVATTI